MISKDITELIGNTPLVELCHYQEALGIKAHILAKLECFNPAGSSKDRVALSMVNEAEKQGLLKPGATIIEPTSGNTGIGLALIATVRHYTLILTMPENMSKERQALLKAYGAQIVLTPAKSGMQGSVEKAQALNRNTPGSIILGQFDNPANSAVHYHTTAQEIWQQAEGNIHFYVATVGTGGTLSGTARGLKEHNSSIQVVAVEPAASPLLSKGYAGTHGIQGIGAGFIPKNYDASLTDRILTATQDESIQAARKLAQTEGILTGFSGGAALTAATRLALEPENKGKNIVVILPDSGERYLSTNLFSD